MTHWAIARPARFINSPETLLWNCRLDGEAYAWFGYYNDHRPHQTLNMKTPRLMYQLAA